MFRARRVRLSLQSDRRDAAFMLLATLNMMKRVP